MSKRTQDMQGGEERYGMHNGAGQNGPADEKPQRATAAQMAARKIASTKKPRGSRSNTPTAPAPFGQPVGQPNPFSNTPSFDFAHSQPNAAPSNPFASPAPSQSFGFGGDQGTQQNGATPAFGSRDSTPTYQFGGNANSGNAQSQQQNGFGSNSGFNFSSNNRGTPSFGSFGQSQPQQNGTTSSSFTFAQNQPGTPSNPFQSTASKPEEQAQKPSTSFGGFGQTQTNGASTPFSFGVSKPEEQAPKPPSNPFGSAGNGSASPFTFGPSALAQEDQRRSESPFKLNSEPVAGNQTPKPASSFGGFGQPQQNPFSTDKIAETPNPTSSSFSQAPPTIGTKTPLFAMAKADEPPKPSGNIFSGFGQTDSDKSGTPQTEQAPKPTNIFSGFGAAQTQQPSSNPFAGFGASQGNKSSEKTSDTDMTTPGNTPQKPASAFPTQSEPPHGTVAPGSTSAPDPSQEPKGQIAFGQGGSLFDRAEKPSTSEPLPSVQKPASSMFNTSATDFATQQPEPAESQTPFGQGRSLFDRVEKSPSPAPSAPSDLFQQKRASDTPAHPHTSLFAPTAPKNPSPLGQNPTIASPPPKTTTAPSINTAALMSSGEHWKEFKDLNESFVKHMSAQNPTQDWSIIVRFYLQEAARIAGKADPLAPKSNTLHGTSLGGAATSQIAKNSSGLSSSNIFAAQTPRASATGDLFSQPPATAPVSKKRAAEEDQPAQPPATEKRNKPNESVEYPKLPETASNTAKLFQAALDKPAAPKPAESSTPTFFSQSPLKRKSQDSGSDGAPAAKKAGGFNPSTSTIFSANNNENLNVDHSANGAAQPSGFTVSGFQPSTSRSSGGPNFLSAFGSKAQEQAGKDDEEREQKLMDKAYDAEYDSENETEKQWTVRYKERRAKEKEEERKKKAAEQGASETSRASTPGSGFMPSALSGNKGTASSLFNFSQPKAARESSPEKSEGTGKSLFDRIEKPSESGPANSSSLFSNLSGPTAQGSSLFSSSPAKPSNLFGTSESAPDDKDKENSGPSDHTWDKSTPIKFGGNSVAPIGSTTPATVPPPKFTGLFGAKPFDPSASVNGTKSIFDQATPKATGFSFGGPPSSSLAPLSAGVSRGTTPGVNTDGEASNAEGDDEPSDEQKGEKVEDMSKLLPEERELNEVLLEVPIAKVQKYELGKKGEEPEKQQWMEKGKGPLYILRSKDSGKVRITLKIPPMGRLAMNFEPVKGREDMYKVAPGKGTSVTAIFSDHLTPRNEDKGKLAPFMIQVKEAKDAQEIVRLLREAQPK